MGMPAPRPLMLCHFTAVEVEPPDFVDLAARAGFAAVSLMIQFPRAYSPGFPMTGDTRMRRETRRRLDATGVTLFDAATCRLEPDTGLDDFRALVETAAYLGARGIDVNGNDPDPARLADQFAALCALCAEHGLGVGIEFMMSTQVKTLGDALALIERSGADNAAVTVDALHLARSGGSPADVAALDPAQISYVQLCDGPAAPPAGEAYAREASGGRLLPGDGDLPVRELVDAVGPDVMLGVEAPSRWRAEQGVPAAAYAAQAMDAVRRLLGSPGGGAG
ncbi:sugar phosphate isomerase/epimerase [Trebonia kvetii]|uniref:Sugar phosphate isomerase/epimerase n=2 Tax=Trebonia kvetii TaxID=2480626 RepID=A0A6P2BUM5_9ACTN|nr:sugar phosphate isomerase/epimerase [Trebonia kvetii]